MNSEGASTFYRCEGSRQDDTERRTPSPRPNGNLDASEAPLPPPQSIWPCAAWHHVLDARGAPCRRSCRSVWRIVGCQDDCCIDRRRCVPPPFRWAAAHGMPPSRDGEGIGWLLCHDLSESLGGIRWEGRMTGGGVAVHRPANGDRISTSARPRGCLPRSPANRVWGARSRHPCSWSSLFIEQDHSQVSVTPHHGNRTRRKVWVDLLCSRMVERGSVSLKGRLHSSLWYHLVVSRATRAGPTRFSSPPRS